MITALGGGVGAAKFLEGLYGVIGGEPLSVVVNTGDDIVLHGLRISPDVDTIIYRLSGLIDAGKGWGVRDDTFACLAALSRFGLETWFNIGDIDFATHIYRTLLRNEGLTPSQVTERLARAFGIGESIKVLPMTDEDIETWILTDEGEMHFQEYFVKRKMKPEVLKVVFRNIDGAKPAPGVAEAIRDARMVILCPSNPIISIGPILNVKGIGEALRAFRGKIIAISPLIGGVPLKGPADKLMRGLGLEVSSAGVARLYRDFLDVMVIDSEDAGEAERIAGMGIKAVVLDTVMSDARKASALASAVLSEM
ncbi:MAG TPA: 2-phospho-L-lactate transferase [Thermodesulfobacteriota bacterium]|nr:2-phospho-L-lactate transferase [Thermodesulfobacteriota bacterium]